jgi:hypothetical protein
MSINAITDQDRVSAIVQILCSAEIQLGISRDTSASVKDRIDAVLRRAIKGGLEPRKYAALYIVRKAAMSH